MWLTSLNGTKNGWRTRREEKTTMNTKWSHSEQKFGPNVKSWRYQRKGLTSQ